MQVLSINLKIKFDVSYTPYSSLLTCMIFQNTHGILYMCVLWINWNSVHVYYMHKLKYCMCVFYELTEILYMCILWIHWKLHMCILWINWKTLNLIIHTYSIPVYSYITHMYSISVYAYNTHVHYSSLFIYNTHVQYFSLCI
jgi:hypothetical protein